MKKQLASTSMKSDRLSYLWLIVAVVFSLFATGRWVIPLAAWLAPIFLLRFVRTQQAVRGILLASLVNVVAVAFAFQGAIPIPGLLYYLFALGVGLYATLPYVADRLIANRLHGFVATLVFPLTWATFEYLNSLFNPYGSWGSLAYTQYGNLPLMQLVSVTGLWGISFLIAWLASVVNWAWERDFAWPKVHAGGLLYASILSLVLLFGGARLILFPPQADSVRVAGVSPSRSVSAEFDKQMPSSKLSVLLSSKATETDRQVARQAFAKVNEDLLILSQQAVQAGAKIVLWPEPVLVLQEDESALIARASTLAQQEGIYLDMGLIVFTHQSPFAEDKTMLVDPTGKVIWRYYKAHPVPGEPWPPGDGKVPTVYTPYGRLSNVICFDADFPSTMRQAGQARADLMLVPSGDWREIDPMHTQMATFRAIENGFSLVRQVKNGLSMAVDYEGRVLATADYFTTDQQVMVAYVPIKGVYTIYSTIGDLFAWLYIAGLVIVTGWAIVQRRQAQVSEPPRPVPVQADTSLADVAGER